MKTNHLAIFTLILTFLCAPAITAGEFATSALALYDSDVQPQIDIDNSMLTGEEEPSPELTDFKKCVHILQQGGVASTDDARLSELDCAFSYLPSIIPAPSFILEAHLSIAGIPLLGVLEANCYGTIDMTQLKDMLFKEDGFPTTSSDLRKVYKFKVDGCLNVVLVPFPYCIDIAKDGPRTGEAYAANSSLMAISILYGAGYMSDNPADPPRMKCQSGWASIIGGVAGSTTTTRLLPANKEAMVAEYYQMYKAALTKHEAEESKKKSKFGALK